MSPFLMETILPRCVSSTLARIMGSLYTELCGFRTEETMATIPASHLDILEGAAMGYVATMRPDGRMSVNPVSVCWDGTRLQFSTVKSRKKVRNLEADDRITLCVQDPKNVARYLEVRGRAKLEDDTDRKFVDAMAKKYMGVDHYPYDRPGDLRVTVTIEVEQVSAPKIPGG